MLDFFKEGGISMIVILVLGVVLFGACVRFAVRPERAHVPFLIALGIAVMAASMQGMLMDVGKVFGFLADPKIIPDNELPRVLLQGLKESTRPGTFGGGIVVLAAMVAAIGAARLGRNEAAQR